MGLLLVLFNILKVVLIILLIFIIVVFMLICLIMFVPIKYDICIKKYGMIETTIVFSWLLRFLTYTINVKDENSYKQLNLAGIKLWNNKKKDKKNKKIEVSFNDVKVSKKENNITSDNKIKNDSNIKINSNVKLKKSLEDEASENVTNSKENVEYLKSIYYKIKYIIQYEERNIVINHTKNLLVKLFKIVKPNKVVFNCNFGFEDPSETGYVLGFISMISAFVPFNLNIKGDFNKKIFNLDAKIEGKANLWSIGFPILIYILKKPIRKLIKDRKEDI